MLPEVEIASLSGKQVRAGGTSVGLWILIPATSLHLAPLFWDAALRTQAFATIRGGSVINLIALLVGLVVAHEAIHGLVLWTSGDRGARLALTRSGIGIIPGRRPQTRLRYLALLLAPLATLLPLTVALSWIGLGQVGWIDIVLAGVGHAAGCCLDVYVARWVWALPANALVVNPYPDPLRAYLADPLG